MCNKLLSTHFLAMIVAFSLLFSTFQPLVRASEVQSLIRNGGFEESRVYLKDWEAEGAWRVLRTLTGGLPPHGGAQCAKIGEGPRDGTIYQIVKIPPKSGAILTFWYNLEKNARLKASIKDPEGREVSKTFEYESSAWRSASLKVGKEFAGKEVRVEFIGWGYQEIVYEERLIVTPWGVRVVTVAVTKDYGAWLDDVSLVPVIVGYEVKVSVSGLPAPLSTKLMVDGKELCVIKGDESKMLGPYDLGEKHMISVEEVVQNPGSPGVRYRCKSSQKEVSEDSSLCFEYRPEYRVSIESEFGNPRGSDWYEPNSIAKVSIDHSFPIAGIMGILGARYIFIGWDSSSASPDKPMADIENSPSIEFVVNSPISLKPRWSIDYTGAYFSIGGITAMAILAAMIAPATIGRGPLSHLIRRGKLPPPKPSPTIQAEVQPIQSTLGPEIWEAPPQAAASAEAPSAERPSREDLERELRLYEGYLERLEDMRGRISEEVYNSIKAEYEERIKRLREELGS